SILSGGGSVPAPQASAKGLGGDDYYVSEGLSIRCAVSSDNSLDTPPQEHRELAREAVRKSLVLLKNGKSSSEPLLPLPKKADKILVAGTHADNMGYQCGGWTIEWQGGSGNITGALSPFSLSLSLSLAFHGCCISYRSKLMFFFAGTTILDAVKSTVDPATQCDVFSENPDADLVKSNHFSYAIVVVGEPPYAEYACDSLSLTIPEPDPSTIKTFCGAVRCVVVVITGRPVVIESYLPVMDALVAAWLPGSEGQGVADVLFGDFGFTGTLPRTWFKSVEQLPMYVGDKNYDPLFPFGFGLTTKPPAAVQT
ncbi:hypothetical protein BHM03_00012315, partial [Ensete ventricosum]